MDREGLYNLYLVRPGLEPVPVLIVDPAMMCTINYLSYIYPGYFIFHRHGTLTYSLCSYNQTDQGDEMAGLEKGGLERERYDLDFSRGFLYISLISPEESAIQRK